MRYSRSGMKKNDAKLTMVNILGNPRYKGKHIVVVRNKVFASKTGRQASKVLDRLEKKYPRETPAITYIPKEDTLILWL